MQAVQVNKSLWQKVGFFFGQLTAPSLGLPPPSACPFAPAAAPLAAPPAAAEAEGDLQIEWEEERVRKSLESIGHCGQKPEKGHSIYYIRGFSSDWSKVAF